jgi:hypothetical protein
MDFLKEVGMEEAWKMFQDCRKFVAKGMVCCAFNSAIREEMINLGVLSSNQGDILEFAESILSQHNEEPMIKDLYCSTYNIAEEEFGLMVIGLHQLALWKEIIPLSVEKMGEQDPESKVMLDLLDRLYEDKLPDQFKD